jgi:hypothetical protein
MGRGGNERRRGRGARWGELIRSVRSADPIRAWGCGRSEPEAAAADLELSAIFSIDLSSSSRVRSRTGGDLRRRNWKRPGGRRRQAQASNEARTGTGGGRGELAASVDGSGHKTGGYGSLNLGSDTMLGIDLLYSIGAKGHIYIVHVQVCKYAGKPPNKWGNIIYKYIHLTPVTCMHAVQKRFQLQLISCTLLLNILVFSRYLSASIM